MKKRKDYSKEFKCEAVRLAENSKNKSQVARELGIHMSMLTRWKNQMEENGERAFPGNGKPINEDLVLLQRENSRLKDEVEILKKAVGIFSSRPR